MSEIIRKGVRKITSSINWTNGRAKADAELEIRYSNQPDMFREEYEKNQDSFFKKVQAEGLAVGVATGLTANYLGVNPAVSLLAGSFVCFVNSEVKTFIYDLQYNNHFKKAKKIFSDSTNF